MITVKRYLLLLALMSFAVSVDGAAETQRFVGVKRYWEWSAYWGIEGLDFPLARYRPGTSFRALVFFDAELDAGDPYWGFCSKELGVCQAYSRRAPIEYRLQTVFRLVTLPRLALPEASKH